MASVNVINWNNQKVSTVELPADIFEVAVKPEVLHSVVRWQLASRRQGTHMTKTRGLVNGGGKKPFKQKGTGNARQGSTRSPLMPGGGKIFGPVPRDYSYALPHKVRSLGLKMALSLMVQTNKLVVVDKMQATGKTKELNLSLGKIGSTKAVVVDLATNATAKQACRNLKSFKFLAVEGLNVYDILKFDSVVLSQDSLKAVVEKLKD